MRQHFDNIYVVSPVAYCVEHLRKNKQMNYQFENIQVFFPKYINNPFFWYYGRSLWVDLEAQAVMSLIDKEHLHFDVIHAHFTWPSGAVGVKLKQKYSVPIVITEHTSSTFNKAIETRDPIFTDTWKQADKIIRVKQSDISAFSRVYIPLENIVAIPNGYDNTKFRPFNTQKCREVLHLPRIRN